MHIQETVTCAWLNVSEIVAPNAVYFQVNNYRCRIKNSWNQVFFTFLAVYHSNVLHQIKFMTVSLLAMYPLATFRQGDGQCRASLQ